MLRFQVNSKIHWQSLMSGVLLIGLFAINSANAVGFHRSIYRLQMPINVADVLLFNTQEKSELPPELLSQPWPETMHGWVDQKQVSSWLSKFHEQPSTFHWTGVKKAWVKWCYLLPVADWEVKSQEKIHRALPQYLTAKTLNLDVSSLPCLSSPVSSVQINSVMEPRPSHIRVQLLVETSEGIQEHIVQFNASLVATGLQLMERAENGSHVRQLELINKSIPWRGQKLLTRSEINDFQLSRQRNEGAVLTHRDVTPIPLVAQGQQVKVNLLHGAIQISTEARALAAGNLGEEINIKVQNSPKISKAIIVAKGVVNVSV